MTHRALHCYAKRSSWRTDTTHLHISLRLAPWTKDYFLAASHAGIVLQGLPRLKAKDVADVKSLSRTSLSLLTMCVTLQSPLISPLQMARSALHAQITQHCHTWHTLRKGHQSALWYVQIWIIIISDNDIKLTNEMEGSSKGSGWGKRRGRVTTVYVTAV